MRRERFHWVLPALLIAGLFFGCGRKPGEKLYQEALTHWRAGNRVRARALLEKSIRRSAGSDGNSEAYNRLGVLLWEMGQPKEASEAFAESCRLDGTRYEVLCNLGMALGTSGEPEAAERAFREALLLQPDDIRPLAFAGILYAQAGRWQDAARNLNRAVAQMPDDPRLQNALALTELHLSGPAAALKRLKALARRHPDYEPAAANIALIEQNRFTGRAEPERISFTPPVRADRARAEKLFQAALALHKKQDLPGAIRVYIQVLEADDRYEQAFYNLGLACYASDQMELAADAFDRAIALNPAFTAARYNRALTDYRRGNLERARSELETVLSQQPGYQPALDLKNRLK
jgi:tetratricopeptide (TPR) repeat protein